MYQESVFRTLAMWKSSDGHENGTRFVPSPFSPHPLLHFPTPFSPLHLPASPDICLHISLALLYGWERCEWKRRGRNTWFPDEDGNVDEVSSLQATRSKMRALLTSFYFHENRCGVEYGDDDGISLEVRVGYITGKRQVVHTCRPYWRSARQTLRPCCTSQLKEQVPDPRVWWRE